jgi:hypothetical protein
MLVNQVCDQLDLMAAFEVRQLGRITSLNQRIEAGLYQTHQATAQNGWLAEEVSLRLVGKRGL